MISSPKNLYCKYTYVKVINFIYDRFVNYDLFQYQNINVYICVYAFMHVYDDSLS